MMTQAFEYLDIQWDDARGGRKIAIMVISTLHYANHTECHCFNSRCPDWVGQGGALWVGG